VVDVIATSPDASRAASRCAWCEQPLVPAASWEPGPLRCTACGARTASAWPAELEHDGAVPAASACARRRRTLGEAARRRARRRLAARIARVAPPGAVLEVGSGDGLLLDALRETGRIATGIERRPTRAGVHDAEITELGGRYAAIVFWQSLERLHAPGAALEHAAALLKPGGLLAIAQPSRARVHARALGARWLFAPANADQRVVISPRSLRERLSALGLQVERADHLLDRQAAGLPGVVGGVVAIEARR
jgi:SAM-dependent methyltransferase